MTKIFGLLLLIFSISAFAATDKVAEFIVVAEGYGQTRDDALKSAFKDAVYLAVGSYILSDTRIKNDDISEKIYVNADAVITRHTVLEHTKSSDGTHYIKVRAAVVKNELAHRIKKYATRTVSQTGVISNTNKQEAHEQALEALQMLTKDLPVSILNVQAIGEPEVNTEQTAQAGMICLKQKIRISIDYRAYRKFAKQLENLLATVATQKERGIYSKQVAKHLGKGSSNFVIFYRTNPSKIKIDSYSDLSYTAFKIPKPFIEKLFKRYHPWSFLLILKDSSDQNVYARNFFYIDDYVLFGRCTGGVAGKIWFCQPLEELGCANLFPCLLGNITDFVGLKAENFTHDFEFEMPKIAYQKARKIEIIPVSGAKSLFLKDIQSDLNTTDLIAADYLPAINYQSSIDYQTVAAFMGHFPAQKKLQWNNGGLNSRIGCFNSNRYFTAVVRDDTIPGLPKGSVIKKINGIPFETSWGWDKRILEIGKLPPGTEVELELNNGKKLKTELVPLDETRWQHKIPLHFSKWWGDYSRSLYHGTVKMEQRTSLPLDILEKLDEM